MVAYVTPFYQWVPGSGTASDAIIQRNRDGENHRAKVQCFFLFNSPAWVGR